MAAPEAWNETCLINLNDGTTDMNIAPIMSSVTINQGGRPVESVANLSGGRILIIKPEEDTEIEFEGMPVGIGDKDATSQDGLDLFFHSGTSSAAPYSVTSALETTRTTFTLTIMWTDSTATSATAIVPSGNYALRYNFANCYMTNCQPSFTTDGGLISKFTFKCAPRNKAGTYNITKESTDGTASMNTI